MKNRKAALGFIFVTVLIDVMGIGIIIPIMPDLIKELTGGDNSEASAWYGILTFAYAVMQFFFAPVLGGLSDRWGRRPILLGSLFGFTLDYILMALAPTLWWLFVGRILSGLFGSSITTANAYVADISPAEKKAQNFGMIGVAFGVGFIIGPALSALVVDQFGLRAPFYAAAILAGLNWLFGYFIVPESLPKEKRRPFEWRRANPIGTLDQVRKRPLILGLAISMFLIYVAAHATQSTWAFYTTEKFDWDASMIGWSLAFVGIVVAIIQGGLIRAVIPKVGEKNATYIGMSFYTLGFVLFAIASQSWMMFAFTVVYALGGLAGPSLQSIMSNNVPDNEQGELMAGITTIANITTMIGPPLMTTFLFSFFISDQSPIYLPGAPFFVGAFLSFICIFWIRRTLGRYLSK